MESNRINALIIDDDPFIVDLLRDKLSLYVPEVNILSTADSGTRGLQVISTYKPDLIFLDVEMTDMTGFEMLSQVEKINFQTIFITSYSHYAIKAIRFNALDYLVKPIDLGELKSAIRRYKEKNKRLSHRENLKLALHNYGAKNVADHKLVLKTQEGEMRLMINDIIRIEGEGNYSFIYLKNNVKKLVTKTLLNLEEMLEAKGFFRCHRSHLINNLHVIDASRNLSVLLSDGAEIPISRRKKKDFKGWLKWAKPELLD
ncbi:MAG: LytTR family DNA-binding domain-containing protein [Saprospiraceae bacterium]|nr:LytTR family DNA-binding domain-containing protein [Saprospiraceae bacterium]